mgnify:CR=1 FL=1
MHDPDTREKMAKSLKRIGHGPNIRGGNGTGPTICEAALAEALGASLNLIVMTKMKRGTGFPSHYKIDLGFVDLRLGIEVDGGSHNAMERRQQDAKKQEFLESIGWTLLRFTNREVTEDLAACVRTATFTISKLKGNPTTLPMES